MRGKGLVNKIINNLPFELHLPGYNYCGPGTKLKKRLARGDKGVNQLDEHCKEHDIAYSIYTDLKNRHRADEVLKKMAKQRSISKDASFGERIASNLVKTIMKAKIKTGMGVKNSFRSVINKTKIDMMKSKPKDVKEAIKRAYMIARKVTKSKNKLKIPRVIPLPKVGGFLPLIPLFAGLSALGGLSGGIAGIAKAVNDISNAKKQLEEQQRHNRTMESKSIGNGLYLKPYKKGLGLYLKPYQQKN